MADDLDDLLRRAMKSLDAEAPSGYFEALPERALARLEDRMEPSSGSSTPREEDSGLHDIRSLAQSTKMRLSSKRQSTHPPMSDEDVLASSSAGWKAVALPEPAKMVSLPELSDLPSKREVAKAAKAAKKSAKEEPAPRIAEGTTPSERVDPSATPAPAPLPTPKPAPQLAKQPAKQAAKQPATGARGRAVAIGGILLAAAAGVAIFVGTNHKAATTAAPAAAPPPTVTPVVADKAPAAPAVQPVAASTPPPAPADTAAAPEATAAVAAPVATTPPSHAAPTRAERHEKHVEASRGHAEIAVAKADKTQPAAAPTGGDGSANDGEPKESFQQLLKEAGVDDTKKVAKPVLSRKMLSADDFKSGMDGVAPAAQGCYKGTQGLAQLKLVVSPSGKVQSASVSGMFAGKPEGACVVRAVRAATFPPWDGGPQTFHYSYLLAE